MNIAKNTIVKIVLVAVAVLACALMLASCGSKESATAGVLTALL